MVCVVFFYSNLSLFHSFFISLSLSQFLSLFLIFSFQFSNFSHSSSHQSFLFLSSITIKANDFSPPKERQEFIDYKKSIDLSKASVIQKDKLKQLLVKRSIKTIPFLLHLQSEGNSIEKLYKKGMLTDDMHFHVTSMKEFVDTEFAEVQQEAEEIAEGWGEVIWKQAMQFYQMSLKQYETNKAALEKIKRGDKEEGETEEGQTEEGETDEKKSQEDLENELLKEEEQEQEVENKKTKKNNKKKGKK